LGVVDNVKDIADLVKKIGDIELYKKILALEVEVMDLTRDKRRADDKVEELERTLQFKAKLTFAEPFYWLDNDKTPYCPACWEDKHKGIHLVASYEREQEGRFDCPTCKKMYVVDGMPWHHAKTKRR
jgi:hypothetical protein